MSNHQLKKCSGNIRTANNNKCPVVGKYVTNISYRDKIRPIEFYVIPTLSQDVYLGIDFWKSFNLINHLISPKVAELDTERDEQKGSPKIHLLSPDQQSNLDKVISKFPSFDREGLGRTHLMEHVIEVGEAKPVKQRHWPISPAIEKLMFEDVDRMLELGIIEESKSPWSSNSVIVKRGEKIRLCLDSRVVNKPFTTSTLHNRLRYGALILSFRKTLSRTCSFYKKWLYV
ncbi:uncharacterized protein LOC123257595 [Drosophila ananassae]|uniref:uncharacterized protein LOC123257595 n=1 Tax=Drosophila ananassae TaxID=7217 RepID=UPI001CFFE3B1|nr:uncharacterized protein LOC123257595 [Drosophila ananassae]